ncbi:hypothetical protein JCM1840_006888 [Sporobolomyces johnsonii]
MARPLPDDPPQAYINAHSSSPLRSPLAPSSAPTLSPPPAPLPAPQPVPDSFPPTSPFYGLAPETVALILGPSASRANGREGGAASGASREQEHSSAVEEVATRLRSSSISTADRPRARRRTPSPPPLPFDSDDSTEAWVRWLEERRARRLEQDGLDATSAATNSTDPLHRLRVSAERLRTVETRLESLRWSSDSLVTRPTVPEATSPPQPSSFERTRRAMAEVRERLDDMTRVLGEMRRPADAAAREEPNAPAVARLTPAERAGAAWREARPGLDRTVTFPTRLEHLAQTLTHLSERASTLSPPSPSSPAQPLVRLPPLSPPRATPLFTSLNDVESPSSASVTDDISRTVRQLIAASRRVTAAIHHHERERESIAATASDSTAPSGASFNVPPLHLPLRVSLPSPLRSSSSTDSTLPQTTSPNPDAILLPSTRFSHSPLSDPDPATTRPFSSLAVPGLSTPENYPGEHAQLLRIAALQRDIATRAGELRELRARSRELEFEESEYRRARRPSVGASAGAGGGGAADAGEKDEDEESANGGRVGGEREVEVEASSSGDETVGHPRKSRTKEERRRAYEVYAFCGR